MSKVTMATIPSHSPWVDQISKADNLLLDSKLTRRQGLTGTELCFFLVTMPYLLAATYVL